MKAVICTKYGGPEVLKLKTIKKPQPKKDEILIKIKASAVTSSDTYVRKLEAPGVPTFPKKQLIQMIMRIALGFRRPRHSILGMIIAGEIVAIGKEVTSHQIGDKLYGMVGSFGGYAEYKCLKEKAIHSGEVTSMPANVNYEEAAAIAYGGALAHHFMQPQNILKNDQVLIYGASGAVGSIAIQLAKAHGAVVTAVCRAANFEWIKKLGADKVIDYTSETAVSSLEQYDLVFDAVGAKKSSPLKLASKTALTTRGHYISVDHQLLKLVPEDLIEIRKYVERGLITPVIDKKYTLDELSQAHNYVDKGHKKGNVIITIESS